MDARQKMKLNMMRKNRKHHKRNVVQNNSNYKYPKPSFDSVGFATGSLDPNRLVTIPTINQLSKNPVEVLMEDGKSANLENPSTSTVKDAAENSNLEDIKETNLDDDYLEKADDADGRVEIKMIPSSSGDQKDSSDDEEEDSLALRCLNFTCQCCECVIS